MTAAELTALARRFERRAASASAHDAAIWRADAERLRAQAAAPVSHLIRAGLVCGTCADEGERSCRCVR